jgi:16S rRNA (guanine966-N2)-methyltransferase
VNNSVRIIGGTWRSRRVNFAGDAGVRPTPDRVRETLFNWLRHEVAGTRCLDLFAGSGALGLEALSRGAQQTTFVEKSASAAQSIRDALKTLGGTGTVIETDAARWLTLATPAVAAQQDPVGLRARQFDLVFLDPPFGQGWLPRILDALHSGAWVAPGALVYLECERGLGAPALPCGWEMLKSKSAGEVGYHLARATSQAKQ